MKLTSQEITEVIDLVKVAVDESSFGPIMSTTAELRKNLNTIPMGIYQGVLQIVMTGMMQQKIQVAAEERGKSNQPSNTQQP